MIYWNEAPEGAQFYSFGYYRKHVGEDEYFFEDNEWRTGMYDSIECHKTHAKDFEIRPIQIGDVYEIMDANNSFLYDQYENGDRFTVSTKSGSGLSFFDIYDLTINKHDILNGYIRLVSTANHDHSGYFSNWDSISGDKQEESYMYGDMTDLKPAKETYKIPNDREELSAITTPLEYIDLSSKDSPIGNILKNGQKHKATEKYRQKLTIAAVQGLSSNPAYIQSLLEQGLNCASDIAYHASLIADNVIDKEWSEDDE